MKHLALSNITVRDHNLTILEGIPFDMQDSVIRCLEGHVTDFHAGDVIFGQLSKSDCTRVIVSGTARMQSYDEDGNRTIIASYGAGDVLRCESLSDRTSLQSVELVADEKCTTVGFYTTTSKASCPCCLQYISTVKDNVHAALLRSNIELIERIAMLANRSNKEKVLAYLRQEATRKNKTGFKVSFNRQEMADFLCIERSSLSRELSKLQKEGVIAYDKNSFMLL